VGRDLDGGGLGAMSMWQDEAEKKGFLIVSPSTQNGAHWWTPAGAAYVRGVILDFARKYRVDADKILATGFSDGGSGAYHLLAHDPSPYACFMPMMGNPLVSRIFGGPTWPQNLRSRPTYAVNGGKDQLYPSGQMEPFIDEMKEHSGAKLEWFDEPEAGHEPSFLQRRWDEMHEWWMAHPRDALPKELVWVSSAPEHDGRFAWVEIRELDPEVEGKDTMSSPAELGIPAPNPRPRLGIVLDLEAGGPGLRIREVQEGTPAAAVGFQPGDVIVAVGEEELGEEPRASVAKLRAFLDSLTDIDGVFVVKRGDEEVELETRPKILEADLKGPERPKALGYDVAPGIVVAKVRDGNVIDIDARGIGKIRVHLAETLLDLDQVVTIAVNGDKKFKGKVKRDPAYILAQAVEQVAGSPRYVAYIDVDVN
jgi:hypothetical protein